MPTAHTLGSIKARVSTKGLSEKGVLPSEGSQEGSTRQGDAQRPQCNERIKNQTRKS